MSDNEKITGAASKARSAVALVFFVFGLNIGTWATHIPFAKERLHASPGWFGASLLCMALGGVISMPAVGYMINRYGSARIVIVAAILSILFLPLSFMASSLLTFSFALLLFGGALGALDVGMNAHGLAVETAIKKPIMSSLHGIYSIAGLVGGAISAVLIGKIDEPHRALISCGFGLALVAYAIPRFLPANIDKGKTDSPLAWPTPMTMGLGFLCLLAIMIEGATVDWSGIYLREAFSVSGHTTAMCFAAYSGGMAISRLLGDRARALWKPASLIRVCALLTSLTLATALMAGNSTFSLIAFAVSGLTLGPVAPLLFIAGGHAEPSHPSRGIASVTTLGYIGSVAGPPLVGSIAQASSLWIALFFIAAVSALIAAAAPLVNSPEV